MGKGTAIIRATSKDSGLTAECTVTVSLHKETINSGNNQTNSTHANNEPIDNEPSENKPNEPQPSDSEAVIPETPNTEPITYDELTVSLNANLSTGTSTSLVTTPNGTQWSTDTVYMISATASASGGSDGYEYRFEVLQNGSVIEDTRWFSITSYFHYEVPSDGVYEVRVTVQDSRGKTATATQTVTSVQ